MIELCAVTTPPCDAKTSGARPSPGGMPVMAGVAGDADLHAALDSEAARAPWTCDCGMLQSWHGSSSRMGLREGGRYRGAPASRVGL
jgi:hypothetical protein